MEFLRKHKNILVPAVILCVLFTVPFFTGCSKDTDRQSFEMKILGRLPETWKYYAVDAVENFLYQESDRYQHSLADIIEKESPDLLEKYRLALRTVEGYRCSAESDAHNQLVKKVSELKKIQAQQSKEYEKRLAEEFLKGITNRDLGITPEMEERQLKIREEKYQLSIQLIQRDMYDDYWFTLKEIAVKDDDFSISKVAILFIYFEKLPKLEVYFHQDPNYGWVCFYSMIDFLEYFVRKHVK